QIAAAIPVSNMLSHWQAGTTYRASDYLVELAVMLLFILYASVMYYFIIATGWRYIGKRLGKLWLRRTLGRSCLLANVTAC
ncbi:MAG: hypothetical protein AAFR53_12210, partial [Pseudomonadota bacterium]